MISNSLLLSNARLPLTAFRLSQTFFPKLKNSSIVSPNLQSLSNPATMGEPPLYPQIEPTTFDLIAIGTGLAECIVAAAASASGKTVLHLDTNPFYGSHYSSLSIPELTSFLNSNSTPPPPHHPPLQPQLTALIT
ncbi:unnamed protein product [Dovyalis caffra]|uniref:Uncharacterized protein n=1 Tax=Dovyalis caffra TaxID=77055 RepID=A0AAV1QRB9_9ROSI|nr:unnamed protein product [Dovyalis caffra]